jgi:hypothetical protein
LRCNAQQLLLAPGSDAPTFHGWLNDPGERHLDLAQRINVLAVLAAFVFVGAVLFGMF